MAVQAMLQQMQCKSIADALFGVLVVDDDIYVPQRCLVLEALVSLLSVDNSAQLANITGLLIELNQRCSELKIWAGLIAPLTSPRILEKVITVLKSEADLCVRAALTVLNTFISNQKYLELLDPTALLELLKPAVPAMEAILTRSGSGTLPAAFGQPVTCVGETRIRCLEFISTLYRTGSFGDLAANSRLPELAIALFMDFPWNSFLHQACYQLIQTIMSGDLPQQLLFLTQTHLPSKLAAIGTKDTLSSGQTLRKCSLGYVIRISQLLQKASEASEITHLLEQEEVGWGKYVSEVLSPLLKVESTAIGAERKASESTPSESELDRLTTDVDVRTIVEVFLVFPCGAEGSGGRGRAGGRNKGRA